MRRKSKNNIGVYSFIDASGLLENGTGEAIELAKKQYWKDYRKKWNKEKRKSSKSFQIVFDLLELRIITREAEKNHIDPTTYIKQSALANKQSFVSQAAVGEIRELVVLHHNTILTLIEENELSEPIGNVLLNQASHIERELLDFIHR